MPLDEWQREKRRLDSHKGKPAVKKFPLAMPFGKYKGKRFADIPEDYLRWVLRASYLEDGLRQAIDFELTMRHLERLP
jgi:uncharacterized protein (DUF3820 family)